MPLGNVNLSTVGISTSRKGGNFRFLYLPAETAVVLAAGLACPKAIVITAVKMMSRRNMSYLDSLEEPLTSGAALDI